MKTPSAALRLHDPAIRDTSREKTGLLLKPVYHGDTYPVELIHSR